MAMPLPAHHCKRNTDSLEECKHDGPNQQGVDQRPLLLSNIPCTILMNTLVLGLHMGLYWFIFNVKKGRRKKTFLVLPCLLRPLLPLAEVWLRLDIGPVLVLGAVVAFSIPATLRGRGKFRGWGVPQFNLFSLSLQKGKWVTPNRIPGVTPLPQFHFEGGDSITTTVMSLQHSSQLLSSLWQGQSIHAALSKKSPSRFWG